MSRSGKVYKSENASINTKVGREKRKPRWKMQTSCCLAAHLVGAFWTIIVMFSNILLLMYCCWTRPLSVDLELTELLHTKLLDEVNWLNYCWYLKAPMWWLNHMQTHTSWWRHADFKVPLSHIFAHSNFVCRPFCRSHCVSLVMWPLGLPEGEFGCRCEWQRQMEKR